MAVDVAAAASRPEPVAHEQPGAAPPVATANHETAARPRRVAGGCTVAAVAPLAAAESAFQCQLSVTSALMPEVGAD